MRKRFNPGYKPYKKKLKQTASGKTNPKKLNPQKLKPGMDRSLKSVFNKIGVPASSPFIADPFQLDALKAIENADCLVTAPTGAGKTWIAEQAVSKVISRDKDRDGKQGRVWYATPLKALTNSIHTLFAQTFGKDRVGILTGDIKDNTDAQIIIGTTEILRNQLYDAMHTGKTWRAISSSLMKPTILVMISGGWSGKRL
jgi:ATP-dependent RNA helicase HelY